MIISDCIDNQLKRVTILDITATAAYFVLYYSQSVFSFSLHLPFHTSCSYRYVNWHALNVWSTHCFSCTRRKILGRSHTHFPTFANIFLKHLVLMFFSKTSCLLWMISKIAFHFKNAALRFTVVKFDETERKIHFVI